MTTIKTPAHLLKPGDRIIPTAPGEPVFVVLCAAHVDPGPVGLQLGRLGEIQPHLERVATVSWAPMELVDVEFPGLTPTQAAADDLAECGRQIVAAHIPPDAVDLPIGAPASVRWMRNMLRDLAPPAPPTLEEALALLAEMRDVQNNVMGIGITRGQRVDELLDRARLAGVLRHG